MLNEANHHDDAAEQHSLLLTPQSPAVASHRDRAVVVRTYSVLLTLKNEPMDAYQRTSSGRQLRLSASSLEQCKTLCVALIYQHTTSDCMKPGRQRS